MVSMLQLGRAAQWNYCIAGSSSTRNPGFLVCAQDYSQTHEVGLSALSPAPFTYDLVQRAVLKFQRAVLLGKQRLPAVDLVSCLHNFPLGLWRPVRCSRSPVTCYLRMYLSVGKA